MLTSIRITDAKVLDIDIETVAAGFGDPHWVPQRVTVVAWGWVGRRPRIHATTRLDGPEKMYEPFLNALFEADIVTGHNIIKFDLPVIQADLIRLGIGSLPELLVQDTIRLVRTKGLKKGQDNLAKLFGVLHKKMPMSWQDWEDRYDWDRVIAGERPDWSDVVHRCKSDVRQHMELREILLREGLLKPPVRWAP